MPHLGSWRQGQADGITIHMIDEKVPVNARLLGESPTLPVLRGQRPVVMDAFAFRILAERGKIDDQALAERVRHKEFDVVILLGRIDDPDNTLCPRFHFGELVTQAIRDNYHFDQRMGKFFFFVPNS